jgi:hypothetical protein
MARAKSSTTDVPCELPARLLQALVRQRIIPRFVDSYVEEHGRYGLQVHAALYKDLLALLQREALVAMSAHSLYVATSEWHSNPKAKARPMPAKDVANFRRKFLAGLTRSQNWGMGEALDFQRDLQLYEDLIARSANSRRRKAYEAANHPFVDRCAFLLDASFLEKARMAASRVLEELEMLSASVTIEVTQNRGR